MEVDLQLWGDLELVEPILEGNRNEVWRGRLDGEMVSVRRSRRSVESLEWELGLIAKLDEQGFRVPSIRATQDGDLQADGVIVQKWLDGTAPNSADDWEAVAATLLRLHTLTSEWPQRPGCCSVAQLIIKRRSVDANLDAVPSGLVDELAPYLTGYEHVPLAAIHGDPHASNIRISPDGVGLLDFDESRVDLVWHDLSNLGVQVLTDDDHRRARMLSHAWEVVNGWVAEPVYARKRLDQLRHIRKSM